MRWIGVAFFVFNLLGVSLPGYSADVESSLRVEGNSTQTRILTEACGSLWKPEDPRNQILVVALSDEPVFVNIPTGPVDWSSLTLRERIYLEVALLPPRMRVGAVVHMLRPQAQLTYYVQRYTDTDPNAQAELPPSPSLVSSEHVLAEAIVSPNSSRVFLNKAIQSIQGDIKMALIYLSSIFGAHAIGVLQLGLLEEHPEEIRRHTAYEMIDRLYMSPSPVGEFQIITNVIFYRIAIYGDPVPLYDVWLGYLEQKIRNDPTNPKHSAIAHALRASFAAAKNMDVQFSEIERERIEANMRSIERALEENSSTDDNIWGTEVKVWGLDQVPRYRN